MKKKQQGQVKQSLTTVVKWGKEKMRQGMIK